MGGYCHITRRITVAAIIDIAISSASRMWTVQRFPEGGDWQQKMVALIWGSTNFILFWPTPPLEMESILKNQKGKYARTWNKTILMRPYVLKGIYAEGDKISKVSTKHNSRWANANTKDKTTRRKENARNKNKNTMLDIIMYPLGNDLS